MRAAAIDLGSNSIKLLIVRKSNDGQLHVLFKNRSVVRLGEGTFTKKAKGKIPAHVLARTLKVFQSYAKLLDAYKVDLVRATGTAALRESVNGPAFVNEVRVKTGIALEILPASEEARLIVKGVSSDVSSPRKPALFIDLGGGSCEISLVKNKKFEKFVSLPLGAVRLTEIYVPQNKASTLGLRRLDLHIKKVLSSAWPEPPKVNMAFGSAGTLRALARLVSKTELTDDDRVLTRRNLDDICKKISKMSRKQIAALPGIDSKRAEILVAGAHTVKAIFDYFKIDKLRVSQRGLREGMVLDLFEHPQKPTGFQITEAEQLKLDVLYSISRRYNSHRAHCNQVWYLSRLLFEELKPVHGLGEKAQAILMAASILHDIGRYVNESSKHKHSYYLIRNTPIGFLSEREHLMAAVLARYHRKSTPSLEHEGYRELTGEEKKLVDPLVAILRLADAFDNDRDQPVRWLRCQWGPGRVVMRVDLRNGMTLNQAAIRLKGQYFENLFKVKLEVVPLAEVKSRSLTSLNAQS